MKHFKKGLFTALGFWLGTIMVGEALKLANSVTGEPTEKFAEVKKKPEGNVTGETTE